MKGVLYLLLFISIPLTVEGQSVRDSVIGKTWMHIPHEYLKLGVGENQEWARYFSKTQSLSRFSIDDKQIVLYIELGDPKIIYGYEYYGDSMVLNVEKGMEYLDLLPIKCPSVAWAMRDPYGTQGKERVLYDSAFYYRNHAKFDFLKINNGKYTLEIDSSGNILMVAYNIKGLRGHYRQKMNEERLQKFKALLIRAHLDCYCGSYLDHPTDGGPYTRIYYVKNGDSTCSMEKVNHHGQLALNLLYNHSDPYKMTFQNYVDGDSVQGMTLLDIEHTYYVVFDGKPELLGSYTEYGEKQYLYKSKMLKQYYPNLEKYELNQVIYFTSAIPLDSLGESYLALNHWYRYESAREEIVIYSYKKSFTKGPAQNTVIVQTPNFGMMGENDEIHKLIRSTKFLGIPFLRMKPNRVKAIEKYVLPNWEAWQEEN